MLAQPDLDGAFAVPSPISDLHTVTGLVAADTLIQRMVFVNRLSIHGGDEVAFFQAGLIGWATGLYPLDQRTGQTLLPEIKRYLF